MNKRFIQKICTLLFVLAVFVCMLTACATVDFKIGFVVDGEIVHTIRTNGDEIVSMPPDPQKEGYIFDGWYWDKDTWNRPFTANSLLNEPLKADMAVYAKWKRDCEHNEVVDEGYAATCTENGLTDGSHCDICGDIIVEQEVIPAIGHDIKQADAKSPTCTAVGWNAYEYCSKCDYTTKVEIEANGHTESDWIEDVAPQCLVNGHKHKECTVCHATVAEEDIDALQHNIQQAKAKAPTCTEVGWEAYEYCTRCDYSTKVEIKANGHTAGGWIVDVEPSCETKGHKHKNCAVCGDLLQEEDIVATGHHFSAEWKTDETYHWHNADCGHSLTTEKVKHTFDGNWKCTVCDYQDVALHGTELKAKTLSVDGTNLYTKVSNATETFSFVNEIRVADGAIYTVHTDISCSDASELRAKTAPLQIGDNTLYILVSNGNDIELYTTIVRRRPIYTVSFDTLGGSEIESRQIEEDSLTAEPSTARNGYIFDGWDYNFENAITEDTVISAKWITIVRNIQYTLDFDIEHNNPLTYIYDDETIRLVEKSSDNAYFISWYLNGEYVSTLDAHQLVDYNLVGYVGTAGLGINGVSVTSYSGTATEVIVPTKYKGNDIDSIGQNAFKNGTKLTDIVIPDSVTNIGSSAFYGCSGLISSTIPDSVTSIGGSAFSGCSGLTSVAIPNSVTSVGGSAFSGCSGLTSVTIGNSVTSIGGSAFYNCSRLTRIYYTGDIAGWCGISGLDELMSSDRTLYINNEELKGDLVIPDSVTSIGDSTFSGCSGLTGITIPDSVMSLGSCAFYNCSGLTSVTIGSSVTSIDGWAFYGCSGLNAVHITDLAAWCRISFHKTAVDTNPLSVAQNLYLNGELVTDLVIPDGVRNIGDRAFSECSGLTSVTIPDSVTSIGYAAFSRCSGLTSVTIGNSVTSIGDAAFSGCSGLTSITIPDSVTSIGNSAFSGCSGLTSITIPFVGASKDGTSNTHFGYIFGANSYSYNSSYVPSSLKTVVITGGTSIGNSAFRGCNGLTIITIPDSVTSIGSFTFYGCSKLTSITIPNSVTSIGSSAFAYCSGLTSITIPDSVTSIGYAALWYCSGLTSVMIPFVGASKDGTENTHFGYIFGTDSYSSNGSHVPSSLKTVVIMDSVKSIGEGAFYGCSGLTSVTIPDSVTSIGNYAFEDCSGLTSITIPDSVTSIGERAFSGCRGLLSITIPDSVTSIGGSAFSGCSGLLSITIPDSVTSIGGSAFFGCSGLTSITIPDSVTSIGSYAFYGCSKLTSITIPDSVTSIGGAAFSGCRGLTSITIPDSVTSICNYAFSGCSGLTSITIPDSVTSIGSYAFEGCSGLTSVTIGNGVTSIGNLAFDGCSGLTSVYYKGTAADWGNISIGSDNGYLKSANRYYYSETEPPTNSAGTAYNGKYWHYDESGAIVVWKK